MNTHIIAAIVALLALVGLAAWGRGDTVQSRTPGENHVSVPQDEVSATSPLTPSETFRAFGTISMKDGLAEHTFTVTNSTDAPVLLKSVSTSCMCTKAFLETKEGEKGPFGMQGMGFLPLANETMLPGESRGIRVVYDPNAHGPAGIGEIERFVYLVDDAERTLKLGIGATVTP